jgi:hypothetical protein
VTEYTETAGLATQFSIFAERAELVAGAAKLQANRLLQQGPGGYADVHAEESLTYIADALRQLLGSVEATKQYTRTGIDRHEANKRKVQTSE